MKINLRNLALAAGGVGAATVMYAWYVEPRWLQRTHTQLHFHDLPPALEGLRIALISDLHASGSTPRGLIRRTVDAVLAEGADIIAVTGDIAEDERSLETALQQLERLHAPLGTFIVPGNHDYRDVGIGIWRDAVRRRPQLQDVTNRTVMLDVARNGAAACLCLAGVDDLAEGEPHLDMLYAHHDRDFTILLAHNPDQAERARRAADDVDLVLSGHTHGGQVRLPVLGAVVNSAEHADLYEAGVRRRPWTQVYTTRGVGTTHMRLRLLTRPEVAFLTLTGAARPAR